MACTDGALLLVLVREANLAGVAEHRPGLQVGFANVRQIARRSSEFASFRSSILPFESDWLSSEMLLFIICGG